MSKFTEKEVVGLSGVGLGLDDLVRQGARQMIPQAIEAELAALLERFKNVKTLHGQRAVVRNGYQRVRRFDRFVTIHAAKYPRATETLKKDRESLLPATASLSEWPDGIHLRMN
jgi:transposase-like protein